MHYGTIYAEQLFPKIFFLATAIPWFHEIIPTAPLPYPIKSIIPKSGLHNPLRKIIMLRFRGA
jgi:hypothetical protein